MMMNNKPPSISLRVWQGTPALFSQTSQSPHVPPHPAQLFCWLGSLAGLQGFGLDMVIRSRCPTLYGATLGRPPIRGSNFTYRLCLASWLT